MKKRIGKVSSIIAALVLSAAVAGCAMPLQYEGSAASDTSQNAAATMQEEADAEIGGAAENDSQTLTPEEECVPVPAVGEVIQGFAVQEVRDFPLIGGTAVLFEHESTGAKLMYIANSDTNRVFDLTFQTRAIDNTGLPHVFEHATLNGSEKYPSTSLFFNLSFQTYNTFMNAMTYPLMTTYPVASLSEEQLLRYADFYTDSCLHPLILEKESIYREEAWRYRLADPEDELTIEGTVYSEMLAAMDLDSRAAYNMFRTAFPGSVIGNVSGGDPEYIPDMTWEALQAYHELYYHPSNAIAFLYGQFDDYTAFLQLLDEAFSPYEKREFSFGDEGYVPLEESVEASFAYPVEASSDTENASVAYYTFLCPGLSENPEEELILNTLTDLLVAEASPLTQQLKKVLPAGSFYSYIETEGPEDAIVFVGEHLNPEDAALFQKTVDDILAQIAETGFSQDLVDGIAASLNLNTRLVRESSSVGVNLIPTIAYSWTASGRPFDYQDYTDGLDNLDAWNQEGRYQKAISEWLLNDPVTVLVTTYPEPGLKEQQDEEKRQYLAQVKASMTEEELQAVIDETNAEKEQDDSSAYLAQLQAVTVDSLPEEIPHYEVTDELDEDGVRRLSAEADVDGVEQVILLLDAAGLPQEDIHWFSLYTDLVGELPSSQHTSEELATLMTRYLYSSEIRLSLVRSYGTKDFHPYLRTSWISTDEDLADGYDLIHELLYDSQFTDIETLAGLIAQAKASLKFAITSNPYNPMLYRAFSLSQPLYEYYYYFNFLDYYAFLSNVEELLQEDPGLVTEKLAAVQNYFHNRSGAISICAGNKESIAENTAVSEQFLAKLDNLEIEPAEYTFEQPAGREALIVDSNVQYNGIVSDYETAGLADYTADLDAVASLVSDLYLFPMLREQYGVYTPWHGFVSDAGPYFISYRDPNVSETFTVYEQLPAFIAELDTDQDTIDGYILSSYSGYALADGELSGAMNAVLAKLQGEPEDLALQYMRELKSLTPEKLHEYAKAYENLMENGYRFTAGGAAVIGANAELYDQILNPFGAVDISQATLEDVPEDSEYYEAVHFVLDNMLMIMEEETAFGVEEGASAGELAGGLYAMLGGDARAPEEGVAMLTENGLVPDAAFADPDAPLSLSGAQEILAAFSAAVGIDYDPDSSAAAVGQAVDSADVPLSRGQLAEVLYEYARGLE